MKNIVSRLQSDNDSTAPKGFHLPKFIWLVNPLLFMFNLFYLISNDIVTFMLGMMLTNQL